MTIDELKNDCNFPANNYGIASELLSAMRENALPDTQYTVWLNFVGDELVFRTFAYRERKCEFQYTEVERKTLDGKVVRKNIYLTPMSGYRVVFEPKTVTSTSYYAYNYTYFDATSDWNVWYQEEKPMNIWRSYFNIDHLQTRENFRYCGYTPKCGDLYHYLKLYIKDPNVEYFGKMGITPRTSYMNKIKKDKAFIKFLSDHKSDGLQYGPQAVIYAYDHNIEIINANAYLYKKREAEKATSSFENIKQLKVNRVKLCEWIRNNGISIYDYKDYWKAIVNLGLDVHDTKNMFPKDFQRMHDLRVDEYAALKAKQDEEAEKELNEQFIKIATDLKNLELENSKYQIIIPETIDDIRNEGTELHHCVYKMGYHKKMIDGRCIIAFLRNKDELDKPFVTVEYVTDRRCISQCYADHDSKPADEVVDFAEFWGKYVTRKMKKEVKVTN